MTKRNPMARELRLNPLYRARTGKSRREIERRADRWNRAAKHKPTKGTPGSAHGPGDFFAGHSMAAAPSILRTPCGQFFDIFRRT